MNFPVSIIVSILEILTYDTYLAITRFPCSVTIREELANALTDVGFIELCDPGYRITPLGEQFLNNSSIRSKI
jgi:predicted transcriptional regulator